MAAAEAPLVVEGGKVGKPTDDAELRTQRLNAARFKRDLGQLAGGLLDAEEVRIMLGYVSKQAVYKAVAKRRLLAVKDGGRLRFPRCQFHNAHILPGMTAILRAVPETSGWRILQYLYAQVDGLAGARPIELINGPSPDLERAVRFARHLEQ